MDVRAAKLVEHLQKDDSKDASSAQDKERLETIAKDEDRQYFQKAIKDITVKKAGKKLDIDSEWEKIDELDVTEEYVVVELTVAK